VEGGITLKKAFTLIELLIVVAIIAILAAIAVPNFLEAQTRAKVSRVTADMRSYATGLETYFIDHNSYPVYFATGMRTGAGFAYAAAVPEVQKNYNQAAKEAAGITPVTPESAIPTFAVSSSGKAIGLTTPVSYMNTYTSDAFNTNKQVTFNYVQGTAGFLIWSVGADGVDQLEEGHDGSQVIVNGGQSLPSPYLLTGPAGNAPKPTSPSGAPTGGKSFTYDPTNGTASDGDVIRTK